MIADAAGKAATSPRQSEERHQPDSRLVALLSPSYEDLAAAPSQP